MQVIAGISRLGPDFYCGAVRIGGWTYYRYSGRNFFVATWHSQVGLVSNLQQDRVLLGNMCLSDHTGRVHHNQKRGTRRGHFSCVESSIGNETTDWATNLRVTELCPRAQIFPTRGLKLATG